MKPCIRCGKFKKVDEFYKHPRMRDGHLNKCKECCKEYARHTRHVKSGDAEWVKKERARGRNKYHRLYAPEHPLRFVSQSAPQWVKDAARNSVNSAVRDGRLPKPTNCEECGRSVPSRLLHGHHDDYYKPLDVRHLPSRGAQRGGCVMRHLTLGALIGMAAGFVLTVLSRAGTVGVDEVWDDVGLAMRVNGRAG